MKRTAIKLACRDTLPIMAGYLFLGFGFGILLQQKGFGVLWALSMSITMYAGSMQYVAVGILASGTGLVTAALTTLLVNARHLFYGISMIDRYKGVGKRKLYLIFAMTDETFSLVSRPELPEQMDRKTYFLAVSLLDHCYWIVGCCLGNLAGSLLPINFEGIEFVLTALFITIFVEQWCSSKQHLPAIIGVAVTVLSLLLFGGDIFLIPAMVAIACILSGMSCLDKRKEAQK